GSSRRRARECAPQSGSWKRWRPRSRRTGPGGAQNEGKVRSGDQDDHRLQGKAVGSKKRYGAMAGFNLQELMSQAKQQYETLQKKMQETVVEGSAGGGTVTVKMDGRKQVLGIKIDPEAVKADDLEMLQDLITAAINGAGRKVDEAMQSTMGGMRV